jgi:tetratricopeptide (TPR) repeat protein
VNSANRQQALNALESARPYVARLDVAGHPEDVAADLVEGWSGVCTALRSLLGGSQLDGQALVREVRQREIFSLETAHALLEFHSARERAQRTTYRLTGADVAVARDAYQRLEGELRNGVVQAATVGAAPGLAGARVTAPPERLAPRAAQHAAPPPPLADETTLPKARRVAIGRGPIWRNPLVLALLAVAALAGGYFAYAALGPSTPSSAVMTPGVDLYRAGRRQEARAAFERIARENPRLAGPHVYLGRLAREEGDLARANEELRQAIALEPRNLLAQREMGQYLLAAGNPDLARRFLIRAVEIDSTDAAANGWLGCALVRLNNRDVADRFLRRAGPGDWTGCANSPVPQPGAVAPTAYLPQRVSAPSGASPQPVP